jgi:hypothetical protein
MTSPFPEGKTTAVPPSALRTFDPRQILLPGIDPEE